MAVSKDVRVDTTEFPSWEQQLTLLDCLEDLLVALGIGQRHSKVDHIGGNLGILDGLEIGAWVIVLLVGGLGDVGLQLPVEGVGNLLLELILVCLLVLLVLLLVDAIRAQLLLFLFFLVLLGLEFVGSHRDYVPREAERRRGGGGEEGWRSRLRGGCEEGALIVGYTEMRAFRRKSRGRRTALQCLIVPDLRGDEYSLRWRPASKFSSRDQATSVRVGFPAPVEQTDLPTIGREVPRKVLGIHPA